MLHALAFSLAASAQEPVVFDAFDRDITVRGVHLTDWEGQIANPAIKVKVKLPDDTKTPAILYVHGTNARIHFDRANAEDRSGVGKRIPIEDATKPIYLYVTIFPDRDDKNEMHELVFQVFTPNVESKRFTMPVTVTDQDKPGEKGTYPITLDYSEDKTGWIKNDPEVQRVVNLAAQDWAYFLMDMGQDEVPARAESIPIWGTDGFVNTTEIKNARSYKGYLMYICGIHHDEMRAGGAPSTIGQPQTVGGKPTTIRRAGTVEFDIAGNWNRLGWFLTKSDDDWWVTGGLRGEPSDLYSIAIHEMGHALGFHPLYPVYGEANKSGFNDPALVKYLGFAPKIDPSQHLIDVIDPVSLYGGYGMEYRGKMKSRRWLITKSHLLCMKAFGYNVRHTAALDSLEVPASFPISPTGGNRINARLPITGGIPTYHVKVVNGSLPSGLTLDSFTGALTGSAPSGGTEFTVEVDDNDPTTPPVKSTVRIKG